MAANRIGTDLVMLSGIREIYLRGNLIAPNDLITVRMGTKHVLGKGDFSIGDKEGDVFNVAESFLINKLRATRKNKAKLSYTLFNKEVLLHETCLKEYDRKKIISDDILFFPISSWNLAPD